MRKREEYRGKEEMGVSGRGGEKMGVNRGCGVENRDVLIGGKKREVFGICGGKKRSMRRGVWRENSLV